MCSRVLSAACVAVLTVAFSAAAGAASAGDPGAAAYQAYCAECHRVGLKGGAHGSELLGPGFVTRWGKGNLRELAVLIRTSMAAKVPSEAPAEVYTQIAAYLLQANGIAVAEGGPEAPGGEEAGQHKWQGAAGIMEAAERAGHWTNRATAPLSPVTDELLRKPPPPDWLSWRRTLDGQGYSPHRYTQVLPGLDTQSVLSHS